MKFHIRDWMIWITGERTIEIRKNGKESIRHNRATILKQVGDTKLAAIDGDGTVTFLKPGTVTVTAAVADGNKKSASFKLTYKPT